MSKSRMRAYQISADLNLAKKTAKQLAEINTEPVHEKIVMSGYTNYENLYNSKKSWYKTRGIVALCDGCGKELKEIQKDARGITSCDTCQSYSKRGIAALCCDCNKELTESEIAFERGIITKCASCAPTSDPTTLYIAGAIISLLLLIIVL